MKNRTTYEMEDIMGLITRDLADKGLSPDPGSIVIRAYRTSPDDPDYDELGPGVEIDVNVSWTGLPVSLESPRRVEESPRVHEPHMQLVPEHVEHAERDLLAEAPNPKARPVIEIGSAIAASQEIAGSGPGPFAPEKLMKRNRLDGESDEYPGTPRPRGR